MYTNLFSGHLRSRHTHRKLRSLASTYVTFGANGRDLLVNLGGEQIYLFDIYGRREPQYFDFKLSPYFYDEAGTSSKAGNEILIEYSYV